MYGNGVNQALGLLPAFTSVCGWRMDGKIRGPLPLGRTIRISARSSG